MATKAGETPGDGLLSSLPVTTGHLRPMISIGSVFGWTNVDALLRIGERKLASKVSLPETRACDSHGNGRPVHRTTSA